MKRREFLKAGAAGTLAILFGEAPRALAPRALAPRFYTGGVIRISGRKVLAGHCSILTPRAMAKLGYRAGKASRTVREIRALQLAITLRKGPPQFHKGGGG